MFGISGHVFFAEIIIYAEQEDFMTTLGCNVNACSHNKDNCCCLSSIEVHGNSACKCDETCCGSFYEADSETAKNASESPKINLSISCEASNCVYNEDKKCTARCTLNSGKSAISGLPIIYQKSDNYFHQVF